MRELIQYAAQLEHVEQGQNLPPVDQWRPEREGEIDIVIRRDGVWVHEGEPIRRAALVRLFSTILRKDGEDYFLVTPVEKQKITVEDAPFSAVLLEQTVRDDVPCVTFTTNVGERVVAGLDHPIRIRKNRHSGEPLPYLTVRRNLEALVTRSVYFDLVNLAQARLVNGVEQLGVASNGEFFVLGDIAQMA